MKVQINPMSRMNNLFLNIMEAKEKEESLVYKSLIIRYGSIQVLKRENVFLAFSEFKGYLFWILIL